MKAVIFLIVLALLADGCRKRPHPWIDDGAVDGTYRQGKSVPVNLVVDPASRSLRARWQVDSKTPPAAFNIYIVPKGREDGAVPFNAEPYLGDTNPDDSVVEYSAVGLMNGIEYSVWVELLFADGSKSSRSDIVQVVCAPRGEIVLRIRHKYQPDGFSFSQGRYVNARDTANDLYYFSKDSIDYLCSPARLDGFLKDNAFAILPHKGTLKEVATLVPQFSDLASTDRVLVKPGQWILVRLPDATHALVKIVSVTGTNNERKVKLYYAYSAVVNAFFF